MYTEDLKAGRAVCRRYRNRRIGELLRELDMTKGRSTGIPKILIEMRANGSPAPLFETDDDRLAFVIRLPRHPLAIDKAGSTAQVTGDVTGDVTEPVAKLLSALTGAMSRRQIRESLGLTGEQHFRVAYLKPALESGLIEMTLPDKPKSSAQRYRLTPLGQLWLKDQLNTGRN